MRRRLVAATLLAAALALGSAGALFAGDALTLSGADSLTITDVLIGGAKTGPYALSWNHIGAATVSVSRNGLSLFRGVDYTVDEAAGTVTFARPLAATDVARVVYLRQPGVSQVNAISLALPVADALRGPGGSTLAASYLYQRSPDHADVQTHGFTAALQGSGGDRISGAILLNDPVAEAAGSVGPRKTGWTLSGQEHAGRLGLTGSIARADAGLVGGQDRGLEAGAESLNLGASYRALDNLTAGATFARRRGLTEGGAETRALGYNLAYHPGALSLGMAETTTTTDQGISSLIEEKTDYTLLYKSPLGVSVGASLTDVSRNTGADDSTAKYAMTYSGRDGLSLAAARIVQAQDGNGADSEAVTDRLSLKTHLGPRTLATAAQEVQHNDQGTASTTRLDLATALMAGVDLQAQYLSSGVGTPQRTSQAGFKVTAIPKTQLSGRVGTQRVGDNSTEIVGMDAVVKPTPSMSVGGGVTRRTTEDTVLDTKNANVAFAAGHAVTLSGEYAENPTDDAGQPLLAERSKVNVTTNIGSMSVTGGAGRQVDTTGAESALYEAELALKFWHGHRLYTGYRLTNSLADELRRDDEVYRLGYSRDAGRNFSFSLEAQLLLYRENQRLLDDQTERRAQASMNARF